MSNDKATLRMISRSNSFLIDSSSSPHHFLFQSSSDHHDNSSTNSLPSSPSKPISFPSSKPHSSFIQLDLIKRPSSSRSFKRTLNSSPTINLTSISSVSRIRLPSTSSRSSPLPRKRPTSNSNHRHRPTLPPRLSTSSITTTSPLTVPCGIIAKGKMTLESDRVGSPSEALSRALRAVSRNRSSSLNRSWSRSQTDQSSSPSKEIEALTYPSPSSVTEDSENGFPFEDCTTPNDLNPNSNPNHSSSYITFASLNVHAPPSPPQSPNDDDLSFDSISNLESLPKNWWTK